MGRFTPEDDLLKGSPIEEVLRVKRGEGVP
jgi:hypothetical protein